MLQQIGIVLVVVALCCVIGSRSALMHLNVWYIVVLTATMLIALQVSYVATLVVVALKSKH